jgi:hypothetical protein
MVVLKQAAKTQQDKRKNNQPKFQRIPGRSNGLLSFGIPDPKVCQPLFSTRDW